MSAASQEQRILEVAKELFTQRGFANVAVRDICRAADVTPPTLYYYFKNKGALFDAVVRETISMTEFIGRLSEECGKANGSESQIQAFTRTYLSYFPRDHLNVGLYLRHSTQLDPIGRRTLTAELARIQSLLAQIIRKGIEGGEFRNTDPRMAAECLLGMMHRFVFQRIHFQRNYNASEAASYIADFFLRSMKPTRSE
jgi:AcrR family transcriptional regulator